jgi:hypothetical protein
MSNLVPFRSHQKASGLVVFNQTELRQLLNVYSRRVATGEWRDYAIDHGSGMAVFSIFRHTNDAPLFCVTKRADKGDRREYVVASRRKQLKRGGSIGEVLAVFDRRLRLVT